MSDNNKVARGLYREDGGKWVVDVISDSVVTEDKGDFRKVVLRCVRELQPSPIFGGIDPGEEFEVSCKLGFESLVGWQLSMGASP